MADINKAYNLSVRDDTTFRVEGGSGAAEDMEVAITFSGEEGTQLTIQFANTENPQHQSDLIGDIVMIDSGNTMEVTIPSNTKAIYMHSAMK